MSERKKHARESEYFSIKVEEPDLEHFRAGRIVLGIKFPTYNFAYAFNSVSFMYGRPHKLDREEKRYHRRKMIEGFLSSIRQELEAAWPEEKDEDE